MAVSRDGCWSEGRLGSASGGVDQDIADAARRRRLCWRCTAAGHRVRVVTDAVVTTSRPRPGNRREPCGAASRKMDRHNAAAQPATNCRLGPALSPWAATWCCPPCDRVLLLATRPRRPGRVTGVPRGRAPMRLVRGPAPRARGRLAATAGCRGDLASGHSVRPSPRSPERVYTPPDRPGRADTATTTRPRRLQLVATGSARILTNGRAAGPGLTDALIAERSSAGRGHAGGGALTRPGAARQKGHEYLRVPPAGSARPHPPRRTWRS